MKTIYYNDKLQQSDLNNKKLWLSLGNFDGVHSAHEKILKDTVRKAELYGCVSGVLLLEPHPEIKFRGKTHFLLTTFDEKVDKISRLGIEVGIVKNFDSNFASMSSKQYSEWLVDKLNVQGVSVGYDYSFGNCGSGTPDILYKYGQEMGFDVSVISPVKYSEGEKVSSELCRKYIQEGLVSSANEMLTTPYTLSGKVVKGEGRGWQLGYPTANIDIPTEKIIPRLGVYLVQVFLNEETFWGVCNLGKKPTFQGDKLIAETYLLNNNKDLYGKDIKVSFLEFIRDERKFTDSTFLIEQLRLDVEYARTLVCQYDNLSCKSCEQ